MGKRICDWVYGIVRSYLVKELIDQGANVTGLVRDQVPRSNLYQGSQFEKMNVVQGALEDMQTIERALGEYEIDTVFIWPPKRLLGSQIVTRSLHLKPIF